MSALCLSSVPGEVVREEQGRGALSILGRDSSHGWDDITCRDALVDIAHKLRGLRAVRDGPRLFSKSGRPLRLRSEVFAAVMPNTLST